MPSPFPGMNPWLENVNVFHDFLQHWAVHTAEMLVPQFRPAFIAKLNANIYVTGADRQRSGFIEIIENQSWRLVTVIEMLDWPNKHEPSHRQAYLGKVLRLQDDGVNFVEVDLMRGGPRIMSDKLPVCDYCVFARHAEGHPRVNVWPIGLRQRLPIIRIPLSSVCTEVILDLQAVLDRVYDAAGYADYIYRNLPQPPLHPDDAKWARQFLPTVP